MKPIVRIVSHLGAVGIGIAIAAFAAGFTNPKSTANPAAEPQAQPAEAGDGPDARRSPKPAKETKPSLKANDFQRAWDGLASRKLSKKARISLQKEILAKWAYVDLAGAMDAAKKEAWYDPNDSMVGNDILEAFSQVFSDRPLDAWALIQSGRYGVGVQSLRRKWLQAVAKSHGLLLASMLGELTGRLQKQAITEIMDGTQAGPEREAVLAKIVEQAGEDHDDWIQTAFKDLPVSSDPGELRNRWAAFPAGGTRKIAMTQWAASLRASDADLLSSELEKLQADARAEATQAILSQMTVRSPGLLAALDYAISNGQMESIVKTGPRLIAGFAEQDLIEPAKLAEWGCNLPERPDTVEIYHKAVGRYIREDLPRAKEWLEAMPEGSWQRENGLAEFSQQALWRKNDPASSQWALDSISDPAIKASATKWRHDWEVQSNAGLHH